MAKHLFAKCAIVNTTTGLHSGVWRFWTYRNDVYFAPTDLGGVMKTSLHEGCWQLAYTKEHWESGDSPRNAPGPGRVAWAIADLPRLEDGVRHAWFIDFAPNALLKYSQLEKNTQIIRTDGLSGPRLSIWICANAERRPQFPLYGCPLPLADGRSVWIGCEPSMVPAAVEDAGVVVSTILTFMKPEAPGDTPGYCLVPATLRAAA